MRNIDSPILNLAYDYLFKGYPWFIKKRNNFYQMESVDSHQWCNRFKNENRIKKKI